MKTTFCSRILAATLMLGLAGTLALPLDADAQVTLNTNGPVPTLTGPGMDVLNSLGTATNWVVAPFGIYSSDSHKMGGGFAGVYNITPTVGTMLRADYFDGEFWMPSANLQFQIPITIASNLTVTPFGFTGIAVPLGGNNQNTVQGIFGAGWDIKLLKVSSHYSMAFDVEYWTNQRGVQWRFAPFVWRF